jgi:hypothetical protein
MRPSNRGKNENYGAGIGFIKGRSTACPWQSKEPPTTTTIEIRARPIKVAQSPRDEEISSAGIVRKIIIILMIVGSCRTRRK